LFERNVILSRRGERLKMQWHELDLEDAIITISTEPPPKVHVGVVDG
jgi:hypothetical protein